MGAKRDFNVFQVGQGRRRLPAQLELTGCLDGIFLALGDNADEVADSDHGNQPRDIAHRSLIDRNQAGADEGAGIDAGIGWTHDAAMQHARHAHVVNVDRFAGRFRGKIDARHRLPDDGVVAGRLHRNVIGQFKVDGLVRDQLAIADAAVVPAADQAVFDRKLFGRQFEPLGCARDQILPRLCGGFAQGDRRDLDRLACNGRTLIGHL